MGIYRKADAWIISRLNDLYLWALDWTGVYIGTISFIMGAEQVAYLISGGAMWVAAFMLLIVLLNAGLRYHQQALGFIEPYNLSAEWFEKSPIRLVLICCGIILFALDIKVGKWWSAFDDLITITLLYIWCLKIRDRQKKEFRLPKLAMHGAS